jgi:hypothetical protein
MGGMGQVANSRDTDKVGLSVERHVDIAGQTARMLAECESIEDLIANKCSREDPNRGIVIGHLRHAKAELRGIREALAAMLIEDAPYYVDTPYSHRNGRL